MTSWKDIKLASQGKRLGEDHITFPYLVQRIEIRYMTMHYKTKEHTGVTRKRTQLFAYFPAQNQAEAHMKAPKCPYTEYYSVCMQQVWKMEC